MADPARSSTEMSAFQYDFLSRISGNIEGIEAQRTHINTHPTFQLTHIFYSEISMKKKVFGFDRRVSITLANIATAREIVRIVRRGGELQTQWNEFSDELLDHAKSKLQHIRNWHFQKHDIGVDFFPDNRWKVGRGNNDIVCFSFDYGDLFNPTNLGDPWVGLFTPAEWKHNSAFSEMLNGEEPEDPNDSWDQPEVEWPRWKYLKLTKYANGKSFNVRSFQSDFVRTIASLVECQKTIDKILRQLKTGR
jgi:hypothetical protein